MKRIVVLMAVLFVCASVLPGQTRKYTAHYYDRITQFESEPPVNKNDIVFLGNSLTEGGKWSDYFSHTAASLAKKKGAIRNRGIIGDTADGMSDRLEAIVSGQPRKLFLMCGVNDISHNLSVDSVVTLVDNLVARIRKESPRTRIYLQSLLPFNESFKRYKNLNGKTSMVAQINAELVEVARKNKVVFINLHPLFLEEGTESMDPSITADGLHLNAEGYKIWAEAIRKYVK